MLLFANNKRSFEKLNYLVPVPSLTSYMANMYTLSIYAYVYAHFVDDVNFCDTLRKVNGSCLNDM